MIGETDEMVIPATWLQRLSKRQVYWLIVGCTTLGSAASMQVYTYADMQRRLHALEVEMRQQVREQSERNERQLVTLTQLTERVSAIAERFDTVDARLTDIDKNVKDVKRLSQ
jgi:hypothetical protein